MPRKILSKSGPLSDTQAAQKLLDPKFFIESFFWIIDKQSQQIPLILNWPQSEYLANRTPNDLVLKSRKEGFSTLIEALWLYACLFVRNTRAVTMAQNEQEMSVHRDRINFFVETMGLPDMPIRVQMGKSNQTEMYFPLTGSYYWIGSAGSRTFGRSRDITHFHSTETAHYEDQSVLTGAMNACTPNAYQVLETTANGVGEAFNLLWDETGNIWHNHFFGWHQDPTNVRKPPEGFSLSQMEKDLQHKYKLSLPQLAWRRWKYDQQTDKTKFAQEFPINAEEAFISSGRHVFDIPKLKAMADQCDVPLRIGSLMDDKDTVKLVPSEEGPLSLWRAAKVKRKYLIAADVAEGVPNGCYSVAAVFDRTTWEVVAEYRARVNPGEFGRELVRLGTMFNYALLVPEMNNHGHATLEAIKAEGYPHVFSPHDIWPESNSDKRGFPTTEKTKEMCLGALRGAIDRGEYFENSKVAITEMMRAVRNEQGRMVSESGYTDCIISRAIGLYCLQYYSLDDTYREGNDLDKPLITTVVAGSDADNSRIYAGRENG